MRLNILKYFKTTNPREDNIHRREVLVKSIEKFHEFDPDGYNALMDIWDAEVRGLFNIFSDPNKTEEEASIARRSALSIYKMISLLDHQIALHNRAKWVESQIENAKKDRVDREFAIKSYGSKK